MWEGTPSARTGRCGHRPLQPLSIFADSPDLPQKAFRADIESAPTISIQPCCNMVGAVCDRPRANAVRPYNPAIGRIESVGAGIARPQRDGEPVPYRLTITSDRPRRGRRLRRPAKPAHGGSKVSPYNPSPTAPRAVLFSLLTPTIHNILCLVKNPTTIREKNLEKSAFYRKFSLTFADRLVYNITLSGCMRVFGHVCSTTLID